MTEDEPGVARPDPAELARAWADLAARSQRLAAGFLERQSSGGAGAPEADPLNVAPAFQELASRMMADPAGLARAQAALWDDYAALWRTAASRMLGGSPAPVAEPEAGDRRFKDPAWAENPVFDTIRQSYLLTARWLLDTVRDVDGLDARTARKVDFHTRQFVDAMSPSNFAATNPEVLRATAESGGRNLVDGLGNLLDDLERGKGRLSVRTTDMEAFRVGENVATAPGKTVFRNELMELVQYAPATEAVRKRPLLIVPPWINKFYILDLREKNSFIRWAVAQGLTVFVVSWVNPDGKLAEKTFEDYMAEGPLAALDAIEAATGEREVNAVGYCIGGTLMAATLAWMAARGDDRVKSATFLTTMVDFEEAGDLGVFVDETQIGALEERMREDGYLDGAEMAATFSAMRANDLIWSFVVNNYLLGKDPFPFDLLYWNADSTRMPAAMHGFYLRKMYLENLLVEPGGIELAGEPIDLRRISVPSFILSTREDHIAPWKSTWRATRLYKGPTRFCLAGSGHIAGVVNPPADPPKYGYWVNNRKAASAEKWLEAAEYREGSWWPEWRAWLARHAGPEVPARVPGEGALPALQDAPGSYVKVRAGA